MTYYQIKLSLFIKKIRTVNEKMLLKPEKDKQVVLTYFRALLKAETVACGIKH